MGIKLVVFDIAGTTLKDDEDVVAKSFTDALNKHGVNFENGDLNRVMGYRKIDAIKMILEELDLKFSEQQVEKIHADFIELINQHYRTAEIEEISGASSVFRALKTEGVKIAINTGFSRSTTDIIITKLGWIKNNLIDTSITSDEVEHGRPAADMIRTVMKRLNIEQPGAVAKVGDTPSDLLEGKNADCGLTIGVLYGTHTREELVEFPHDYLIEDIEELKSIIL